MVEGLIVVAWNAATAGNKFLVGEGLRSDRCMVFPSSKMLYMYVPSKPGEWLHTYCMWTTKTFFMGAPECTVILQLI